MAVFELGFDLFDRVMQERIRECSIGFKEGELKALLCELGRFDGRSDSILQPCLSLIHCYRVED